MPVAMVRRIHSLVYPELKTVRIARAPADMT